jgi:uncharacterized protein (DUF302 family)
MKPLILSLVISLFSLTIMAQKEMMLENESKKSFDQTVEWLEQVAVKNKWKVLAIHDLQMAMEKNGYEVLPVKVFAICQPQHAFKVLGKDDERIVSSMMPCRVSVYEKSDGKTYLSRMNTSMMASGFEGAVKDVMVTTSEEIVEMIKPILK